MIGRELTGRTQMSKRNALDSFLMRIPGMRGGGTKSMAKRRRSWLNFR